VFIVVAKKAILPASTGKTAKIWQKNNFLVFSNRKDNDSVQLIC
jgi:hypothetical protein